MRRLSKTDANLSGQPVKGWDTIPQVIPYLWPDGEAWVKRRVVLVI